MLFLEKLSSRASQFLLLIAGVAVIATMLLAISNIVFRIVYLPFGATYEVIALLTAISITFSLGYSQIKKVHITIDLLTEKFPTKVRKFVEVVTLLLSVILFSIVTWHSTLYAGRLYQSFLVSDVLRIPIFPFVYAIALGFAVFTFIFIVDLLKLLRGEQK